MKKLGQSLQLRESDSEPSGCLSASPIKFNLLQAMYNQTDQNSST